MPFRALITENLLIFLDHLFENVEAGRAEFSQYILIWEIVSFHQAAAAHNWFIDHPKFSSLFLRAYSPFLNPTEEFC